MKYFCLSLSFVLFIILFLSTLLRMKYSLLFTYEINQIIVTTSGKFKI